MKHIGLIRIIVIINIIILSIHSSNVNIKTTIAFPKVTITCEVTKINPDISLFLLCPHSVFCFRNCEMSCSNCNISCAELKINENTYKFVYLFIGTEPANWGTWGCNYKNEKVETSIELKVKKPSIYTKRHITIERVNKTNTNLDNISTSSSVLIKPKGGYPIISTTSRSAYLNRSSISKISKIKSEYVIIMLITLAISLLINIWLIIREILASLSSKKLLQSKSNSPFFRCFARCFCVQNYFLFHKQSSDSNQRDDNNSTSLHQHLLSRQSSHNNPYDCSSFLSNNTVPGIWAYGTPPQPTQFHNIYRGLSSPSPQHHAITLDNQAYIGSPIIGYPTMENSGLAHFARSKSFPTRPDMINPELDPTKISTNHLIYDDVPEPSINIPIDYPINYYSPFGTISALHTHQMGNKIPNGIVPNNIQTNRPVMRQNSLPPRKSPALYSKSMNNLNNNMENDSTLSNSEMALKEESYNSRVELSKEMLSQAGTLLQRANQILNSTPNRSMTEKKTISNESSPIPDQTNE